MHVACRASHNILVAILSWCLFCSFSGRDVESPGIALWWLLGNVPDPVAAWVPEEASWKGRLRRTGSSAGQWAATTGIDFTW